MDEGDISDLARRDEEVVCRGESILREFIDLHRVCGNNSQLGLRSRQPDWFDDIVGSLKLWLEHQLLLNSTG